ncbi:hypothetical protein E4634_16430 [Mangrovimicrobium sediminis]|uniref:Nuclear transport factor 2 family protein n=1 Tax=Mangrovimicrobium sediminis TaxID=2562682 RepID=A0A4Z0LX30_9GAMM|nr:hypothetical protein [Haliea sp. SAOS-164]TGD71708.1 hypothetical protein E4634_16430 [Haliea sp. SAOS-164]
MQFTTATGSTDSAGPLTEIVLRYCEMIESRVTGGQLTEADWDPLKEVVAVDEFKRVGAYLEELDWAQYARFLTEWAGGTRFETTVFHITEVGRSVFQEIEERHYKGEEFIRKNVIAVYRFNDDNRISHLDIYEQAQNSGQWIVDAAAASTD